MSLKQITKVTMESYHLIFHGLMMIGCGLKAQSRNQFLAGMVFGQSGSSIFRSFGSETPVKTFVRSVTFSKTNSNTSVGKKTLAAYHLHQTLTGQMTRRMITAMKMRRTNIQMKNFLKKQTGMHKRQSNSEALLVNDKTLLWLKPRMIMRIEGL